MNIRQLFAPITIRFQATDDLEAIAHDDEANVPALQGWRKPVFGDHALALKHGKLALAIKDGKVLMHFLG